MLIASLLIPKETYPNISSSDTLDRALDLMEHHNLRCIPILDDSGTIYRGNIYKYHIYRHMTRGGALHDNVTTLLKNATKFVYDTDDFYQLFFKLGDLPHIAILDAKQHFLGVVRHSDMMTLLSQAWCLGKIGYVITIELPENNHAFQQAIKIIKSFTHFIGLITLDKDQFILKKRIVVSLPLDVDHLLLQKLIAKLDKKNLTVVNVSNLAQGI